MTFLQRVLDSFSRGGVDLFRLRTSVKWASSFAHTIKDIRRLTRRSDILSFSACCLSPIPSGNHSSPAGGTGPPRLLVSCAVLRTGSCEMSRRSESYGLSARNATSRHIPLGNRCAPAGRIHPPAPEVRISVSRRGSICSFRHSAGTARLFPSPKVAAFLLSCQREPSPSAADVPNRRGYLFRLQACSDRPQGCVPRISPLARRCQNDAAGGEAASKAGVSWDTFNGTPKPK